MYTKRVMKVNKLNKKKRKFFTKTAAVLRKERAERIKKNRWKNPFLYESSHAKKHLT